MEGIVAPKRYSLVGAPVFTFTIGGRDVMPRSRRARAILFHLAAVEGHAASRRDLAALFWSRRAPEQAMASLRQCLCELRMIEEASPAPILADRERVRLATDAVTVVWTERPQTSPFPGLDPAFDLWFDRWLYSAPVPVVDASVTEKSVADASRSSPPPRLAFGRLVIAAVCLGAVLVALVFLALSFRGGGDVIHRVAVMPFETAAGEGGVALGEGLTEEITGRVASIPNLAVLGRTSVAVLAKSHLDARQLGERLRVDYLIDGSVRLARPLIQINVSLTRTSDGMIIWSHIFSGRIGDIFAIQDRIATAVAQRIEGSGIAIDPHPAAATSGEIHALYLTARTLLHSRETPQEEAALAMLKTATRLDPSYAPAWATLATGTRQLWLDDPLRRSKRDMTSEATPYALRALALAPDLAEANGVLGALAGYRGAAAEAHIARAVALDPGNANFLIWMGHARYEQDRYADALNFYRRGVAAEPFWFRSALPAAQLAYATGHRDEAARYLARIAGTSPSWRYLAPEALNALDGRFADAARLAHAAVPMAAPGSRNYGAEALAEDLASLGLFPLESRRNLRRGDDEWIAALLRYPRTPVAALFPSRAALFEDSCAAYVVPRLLVRDGRAAELVQVYDRVAGSPEALIGEPASLLSIAAAAVPVMQALRKAGRAPEAARIAALIDARVARALSRPMVPSYLHMIVAQLAAVEGDRDRAIAELGKGFRLGYVPRVPGEDSGLLDLGREPAFASLRAEPRFIAMRAAVLDRIARERGRLAFFGLSPESGTTVDILATVA